MYENAVTERVPPVKVWTVTWTYGTEPRVEDEISFDRMKADADQMLDHFILDYKYANPDKR